MLRIAAVAVLLALVAPASAAAPRILAARDLWPAWSPDGSRIAFTRVSGARFLLEVTTPGTRGVTQLAEGRSQLSPDWSPDGQSVVYAANGAIWLQIADGKNITEPTRLTPGGERAFSPRWSPDGTRIAYLTTRGARNTDLWTLTLGPGGRRRAPLVQDAIGTVAWAPGGTRIAYQGDDGIHLYELPSGDDWRVVAIANPGPPTFSHDGKRIAFAAGGRVWVVSSLTRASPRALSPPRRELGTPSWSEDDLSVVYPREGAVEEAFLAGGTRTLVVLRGGGGGVAPFRPGSDAIAFAGARPACPGHVAIRLLTGRRTETLTGTCLIAGTARDDVIEGSIGGGDVIRAGAGDDTVHAKNGRADTIDCGPGRDIVLADRSDRLRNCEIVR